VGQVPVAPITHANDSSMRESQSSSPALHVSAGGVHAPNAHAAEHVRDPVVPHVVVQLEVRPAQHVKPSSHTLLQSSSRPLHVSGGGEHALQPHVGLHVREPVVPQLVMHEPVDPAQHVKISSHIMSQSSSRPLHVSVGGVQVPHVHIDVQVREPVVMQPVAQLPVDPGTQVNVSSTRPSQSSSDPLHVSAGGVHEPHMHIALHVRDPVDPHVVVQAPVVPDVHSTVSSTRVSQSSSRPLQPSAGGVQAP
jgi:hypothetical protein